MDYALIFENVTWVLCGLASAVCVGLAVFCQWAEVRLKKMGGKLEKRGENWGGSAFFFWTAAGVALVTATAGGWPLSGPPTVLYLLTVFTGMVAWHGWRAHCAVQEKEEA